MPIDPEQREKFLAWVVQSGKKGGRASAIHTGESLLAEGPARIPFLSPTTTYATSGGMPIGHFGRWYGPEGSGKSMTNWGLIYCAQRYPEVMEELLGHEIRYLERMKKKLKAVVLKKRLKNIQERFPDGMSVCLWDTEQRAQLELGARLGCDLRKNAFLMIEENVIEEVINQMTEALGAYHIMIVDSASNAQSYAEANLEPGEYEQGTASQAWKRLRQTRRKLDRMENTIIFVDQMRMQLGQRRGKPRAEPPQNRFLKHNVSLAMEFDSGRKLYLNDEGLLTDDRDKATSDFKQLGSDYPEVAGLEMRCETTKNSTGKPFRHGVMRFKFPMSDVKSGELVQDVEFDQAFELRTAAEYFHVIEAGGGGMFYLLDEKFNKVKAGKGKKVVGWKGEWRCEQAIAEDEELQERIRTRMRMAT